ncbi:MAG: hypothetical protein IJ651_08160 [Bacteroidales bacterium]|nr:hypothetical protein [Bacteroidales bacterium]
MKRILLSAFCALAVWTLSAQEHVRFDPEVPVHPGSEPSQVVRPRFNPEYSIQDLRAEYGFYTPIKGSGPSQWMLSALYTRQFYGRLAFRTGVQLVGEGGAGIPLALVWRPGTVSMGTSLVNAAEMAVYDVVRGGYYGDMSGVGRNILYDFLLALFRRSEYFLGLTPAWYGGKPAVTGDVGLVLSIPIWRIGLNITPVYHYSFTSVDEETSRHFFSMTGGISFLF